MYDMARKARDAMKEKAHRMAAPMLLPESNKPNGSSWTPSEPLNADAKTGMRPVSRRAYKSGGKVDGDKPAQNAGKKPRGGLTANDIVNRNLKDANEDRAGVKHVGGFADGGVPTTRFNFGPSAGSQLDKSIGLKSGGRTAKAAGGAADEGYFSGAPARAGDSSMIRALKEHGMSHTYKNGVLHGVAPMRMADGSWGEEHTPIGSSTSKLKNFLGYKRGGSVADSGDNWIAGATKNKGALHRELDVPEGKKIPAKKLAAAEHSKNPKERKQADLAKTLGRLGKRDGGGVGDSLDLATGGRAKRGSGKTDINIIISAGQKPAAAAQMPPAPPPMMPPPTMPPRPPVAGPPMVPPGGPPGMAPPAPMMRATGGRTVRTGNKRYYDMDGGAGSGLGRLQKID